VLALPVIAVAEETAVPQVAVPVELLKNGHHFQERYTYSEAGALEINDRYAALYALTADQRAQVNQAVALIVDGFRSHALKHAEFSIKPQEQTVALTDFEKQIDVLIAAYEQELKQILNDGQQQLLAHFPLSRLPDYMPKQSALITLTITPEIEMGKKMYGVAVKLGGGTRFQGNSNKLEAYRFIEDLTALYQEQAKQ
jgi:hypothetical protein